MEGQSESIRKLAIELSSSIWRSMDAVLTWCFGIVMLIAAIPHWENHYYFLGSVYAYKLVDPGIGQAVAMLLPLTQLVIAVCLIARIYVDVSSFIAMILFGVFLAVQAFAYFGGLDISCGCFGPQNSMPVGLSSVSFVGMLFGLAFLRIVAVTIWCCNQR